MRAAVAVEASTGSGSVDIACVVQNDSGDGLGAIGATTEAVENCEGLCLQRHGHQQ
jgi:hypothetical protein